jgi:hypothetical protein
MSSDLSSCSESAPVRLDLAHLALSPTLRATPAGSRSAFEIKIALDADVARELENYLAPLMHRDPHGAKAADGAYEVTTLYTDTPGFDVLHRTIPRRRRKFRLRRYGRESVVYLERKTRHQSRVRKKRTSIAAEQSAELNRIPLVDDWAGSWFHRSVHRHGLTPVCMVSYRRSAFVGQSEFGPIRATFDRELSTVRAQHWSFHEHFPATHVTVAAQTICEFKFSIGLPFKFKDVLQRFQLIPGRFSKYRAAAHALGLVPRCEGDEQHA